MLLMNFKCMENKITQNNGKLWKIGIGKLDTRRCRTYFYFQSWTHIQSIPFENVDI